MARTRKPKVEQPVTSRMKRPAGIFFNRQVGKKPSRSARRRMGFA